MHFLPLLALTASTAALVLPNLGHAHHPTGLPGPTATPVPIARPTFVPYDAAPIEPASGWKRLPKPVHEDGWMKGLDRRDRGHGHGHGDHDDDDDDHDDDDHTPTLPTPILPTGVLPTGVFPTGSYPTGYGKRDAPGHPVLPYLPGPTGYLPVPTGYVPVPTGYAKRSEQRVRGFKFGGAKRAE